MNKHYEFNGQRLQTSRAGKKWTCFINEDWCGIQEDSEQAALDAAKTLVDKAAKSNEK